MVDEQAMTEAAHHPSHRTRLGWWLLPYAGSWEYRNLEKEPK